MAFKNILNISTKDLIIKFSSYKLTNILFIGGIFQAIAQITTITTIVISVIFILLRVKLPCDLRPTFFK